MSHVGVVAPCGCVGVCWWGGVGGFSVPQVKKTLARYESACGNSLNEAKYHVACAVFENKSTVKLTQVDDEEKDINEEHVTLNTNSVQDLANKVVCRVAELHSPEFRRIHHIYFGVGHAKRAVGATALTHQVSTWLGMYRSRIPVRARCL